MDKLLRLILYGDSIKYRQVDFTQLNDKVFLLKTVQGQLIFAQHIVFMHAEAHDQPGLSVTTLSLGGLLHASL